MIRKIGIYQSRTGQENWPKSRWLIQFRASVWSVSSVWSNGWGGTDVRSWSAIR